MSRRWAFWAATACAAIAIIHCSSTANPPLESQGSPDGGGNGGSSSGGAFVDVFVPPSDGAPVAAPAITVASSTVDFGLVPCGTTAKPKLVTVTNNGNVPIALSATLEQGSGAFAVGFEALGGGEDGGGTQSKTVAPNEQVSLVLTPLQVPQSSPTTQNALADLVGITTNPYIAPTSGQPLTINVTETPQGGVLQFLPSGANFNSVPVDTTSSQQFQVTNLGNAAVEFALAIDGGVFGVSSLGPINLLPSTNSPLSATFTPTDTSVSVGEIEMTGIGTLCAPLPSPFSLQGQGSSGVVAVSSTEISFGTSGYQPCGTQANGQSVSVENVGNAPFNYTATLTQGSNNFTLTNATNTIQAGQSAQIGVQPNAIPTKSAVTQDLYSGILSISTTAPNDSAHIVQLHMTAQGYVLAVTTNSINFGGVAVDQTSTQQFSITNNGNQALTGATIQNTSSVFAVAPSTSTPHVYTFNVNAGATVDPVFSFTPASTTTYPDTATFQLPTGAVNCGDVPSNITLSGSGTTGITLSQTSLNFGQVLCPTASIGTDGGALVGTPNQAALQSITITNQGAAAQYQLDLGLGAASPYSLTDSTGTALTQTTLYALPSGPTTFNVVPNPVTRPAPTSADGLADTLTITTTAPEDAPHTVGLHQTAEGAVLAYTPTQIVTSDETPRHITYQDFSILNNGNYEISYTVNAYTTQDSVPVYNSGGSVAYTGGTFTLNLPAPGSAQQLFAGQSQQGVLETQSNSCPATYPESDGGQGSTQCYSNLAPSPCTCAAGPWQLIGQIYVLPANGSILCSDPPPYMPLSEN